MTPHVTADGRKLFLGKKPARVDHRDLLLRNYVDKSKILGEHVPAAFDWSEMYGPTGAPPPADTDVLGNNRYGDCVFAGPGHQRIMIAGLTGNQPPIAVTAESTLQEYALGTCFNPLTGENDDGACVLDMLVRYRNVGMWGERILAFARVDHTDPEELMIGAWLGCGLIGGYDLPMASQSQTDAQGRQLWDVPPGGFPDGQGPGTWGGHCIFDYAPSPGLRKSNSWGMRTVWTPAWERACCAERYVVINPAWILRTGKAPNGFALQDLLNDAAARSAMPR